MKGQGLNILYLMAFALPLAADGPAPGAFSSAGLQGWEEHSFQGNTRYELVEQDGRQVVRAESRASASGLFFEAEIDLNKTPYLHWRWRVDNTLPGVDERSKAGDDYPARVYVVKKGGLLPWRTRAVDYVWSSTQPQGSTWPNAYTDRAWMIALRSGDRQLGQWLSEHRNVREDFQRLFGEEVDRVDVVAIMTDTDNSGAHAVAYYGDLYFSAE